MSGNTEHDVLRTAVQVDGETASYLTAESAEQDGPAVLLLHGTYWSRVWLPVVSGLAEAGLRPFAVDFPGLGRSGGKRPWKRRRSRPWPTGRCDSRPR